MTISGTGSLAVSCEETTASGRAISVNGLVVDGVALTATTIGNAAVIRISGGDLTLESGSIIATSTSHYATIYISGRNLLGGKITVKKGVMKATNASTANATAASAIYASGGMEIGIDAIVVAENNTHSTAAVHVLNENFVIDGTLTAKNTSDIEGERACAIRATGGMTVGEDGTVVAENKSLGAAAVEVGNRALVVDGGTLTATNASATPDSRAKGIYTIRDMEVLNGGTVVAKTQNPAAAAVWVDGELVVDSSVMDAKGDSGVWASAISVLGNSDIQSVGMQTGIETTSLTVRDNPRIVGKATGVEAADPFGTGIWMPDNATLDVALSGGGIITATGVKGTFDNKNTGAGVAFENEPVITLGALTFIVDNQELIDGTPTDLFAKAYGKDGVVAEETIFYVGATITATAGEGGSIDPAGKTTVYPGSDQKYTFSANEGYRVKDVFIDGVSKGRMADYTFIDAGADHTIEVVFEEYVALTITGPSSVKVGQNFTMTASHPGGKWDYDAAYLKYENGTFTALKVGKTTITYRCDGMVATHELTITDAASAPNTGDDTRGMTLQLLTMLGAMALAMSMRKRIKQIG